MDRIEELRSKPVRLNKSSVKEIASIPTITYLTAAKISVLAKNKKNIDDIISELKLNDDSAYLIRLCSVIAEDVESTGFKNFFSNRTRAIEQMNRISGFEKSKFTGGRTDLYTRLLASYSNHSAGLVLTKDMGEKLKYGFISGFIKADYEIIKITAGDFYIKSGLGNILWNQNALGKGPDVIAGANEFENSVVDYRSSGEYGFLRGVAAESGFNLSDKSALNVITWYSTSKRAATIDTSLNLATSVYETGLYRTQTEIGKINKLRERTAGLNINLKYDNLILGTSGYFLNYDKEVRSESSSLYSGKKGIFSSIFALLPFQDFDISFESSRDPNGYMAYKLNMLIKQQDYEFTAHARYFTQNFRSPFGYIFGEASSPNNEYGLYSGFTFKGQKNVRLSAYLDLFSSLGPTYYVPQPVKGIDFFQETVIRLSGDDEVRLRLQYERKTDAMTISKIKQIYNRSKYYSRFEYLFYLAENLKLKYRIEANLVSFEGVKKYEIGFAAYVEMIYQLLESLKLNLRFSYFSTASYESAIWQYELILPGYMSSPPLYGKGLKTFIDISYKPVDNLVLSMRYSFLKKYNVFTLGSSYNEIIGNKDYRLYLQFDLNF